MPDDPEQKLAWLIGYYAAVENPANGVPPYKTGSAMIPHWRDGYDTGNRRAIELRGRR